MRDIDIYNGLRDYIYHKKGQSSTEFSDDHICYGDTNYTTAAIIVCLCLPSPPTPQMAPVKRHDKKVLIGA